MCGVTKDVCFGPEAEIDPPKSRANLLVGHPTRGSSALLSETAFEFSAVDLGPSPRPLQTNANIIEITGFWEFGPAARFTNQIRNALFSAPPLLGFALTWPA